MANVGRSKQSTRNRNLPDPCGENRELRRMVQKLRKENQQLRDALGLEESLDTLRPNVVTDWPHIYSWGHDLAMLVRRRLDGDGVTTAELKRCCDGVEMAVSDWKDALDGGGEDT